MFMDKFCRCLDFGKSSGGSRDQKMEYLFGGALALIIILALGLTIKYSFFGGSKGGAVPDELHFFCTACSQEVTIKTKDMKPGEPMLAMAPTGMPGAQKPVCPKCSQPALVMEYKCPLCDQFYVRDLGLSPAAMAGGPKDEICKKCNGNVSEFYRNKAREAK